jgi:hypothetical protein
MFKLGWEPKESKGDTKLTVAHQRIAELERQNFYDFFDKVESLKALVREMGDLLQYRSDGAAHKILTRPLVKKIMEEK